ncbi:MAG: alginate lyase [Chloroflexi bacterium]|nr:MAG: alginate lyase [Chloroflexota bacterium]
MRGLGAVSLSLAVVALAACAGAPPVTATRSGPPAPPVLLMDRAALADARAGALAGRADLAPAITELRRAADMAMTATPVSVAEKTVAAPSGDPHDYVSLSIYWWPDPAKPDGLPYLQRDGQVNPEATDIQRYDGAKIVRMVGSVETLALAGFLTGESAYSEAAALWLRTWFLDERTRMSPSMRFAQIVPGRTESRGTGIIESRQLMRAVDAALLLDGTPAWPAADQAALRDWFAQLVDWLLGSAQGQMEGRATNNHGTWYDAQVADFALFAGRADVAKDTLAQVGAKRATKQIADDGHQPLELVRTRSFHYSAFNLLAFCVLGDLGDRVGVDVWHASPRVRNGIDFLTPYRDGTKAWPHPELKDVDYPAELAPILARSGRAYPDAGYDRMLASLSAKQSALGALKLRLGVFGSLGGTASAPPPWAV